jgi:hypothetical protein
MRNERLQRAIEQSLVLVDRSDEIARTIYGSLNKASEAIRLANALRPERPAATQVTASAEAGSDTGRGAADRSERRDLPEASALTRG